MNKAELVDALETRLGGKRQATVAVEAIVEMITLTVAKGDKVAISGFGTFEKQARNARTGRNPRTGEAVKIKKTSVPRFRPGTAFKEVVSDTKALRAYTAGAKERAASGITSVVPAVAATPARKAAPATRTSAAKSAAPAAAPVRKTAAATKAAPAARKAAPAKAAPAKAAPAAKTTTAAKSAAKTTTATRATTAKTATKRAAAKKA
ncbi:HU family DNA-binding protein [Kineococcus rubinsiae]|uniref:HU family DNA-binding protein n=1 Tax=Kineococcus rubinsiae TaxID=2609562 RepID=UPI00142F6EAB|nr:HU family DNA-binding protein [Kineococcus rubinsiae]NIZ90173.1 HU family DNA-binding protein [Kineococcus rubinsiae]